MGGSRNSFASWFVASVLLLGALIVVLALPRHDKATPQSSGASPPASLLIYCAANLRVPLDEIVERYRNQTGVQFETQYAGSQTILTNAELAQRGDLLLPADDSYIELARQKGMIDRIYSFASMRPVLAVKQGNPKNIRSLDDLLKPDAKFALANPDAAAIGKVTRPVLQQAGVWEKLSAAARTFMPTVTDVANAVKLGTADAGIVWDTTVRQTQGLEAIELPVFANTRGKIAVATLHFSHEPAAAQAFAKFVTAPDGGLPIFERYGYQRMSEQSPR